MEILEPRALFQVEVPDRKVSISVPEEILATCVRRNTVTDPPSILASGDEEARRCELTGGKGSSLAVLSAVAAHFKSDTTSVGLLFFSGTDKIHHS